MRAPPDARGARRSGCPVLVTPRCAVGQDRQAQATRRPTILPWPSVVVRVPCVHGCMQFAPSTPTWAHKPRCLLHMSLHSMLHRPGTYAIKVLTVHLRM